uniref:Uncharacterized protein n=1 Tax=Anguilla anguilla TaxID=7936 RepID=A0A0E9XVP3_ANGAN
MISQRANLRSNCIFTHQKTFNISNYILLEKIEVTFTIQLYGTSN